jgi:hypothetical protein
MNTFEGLAKRWELRPIRNCPGRFVVHTLDPHITPRELLGDNAAIQIFTASSARDAVLVARLDGGGLISYQRVDGTYVHTLNNEAGFDRKLRDLGIGL